MRKLAGVFVFAGTASLARGEDTGMTRKNVMPIRQNLHKDAAEMAHTLRQAIWAEG